MLARQCQLTASSNMAPSPQSDLPIYECPKPAAPSGTSNRKSVHFSTLSNGLTLTSSVEDYRPGYPRYAALLSVHNAYFLCRKFDWLRARLLLQKQDKLSILEEKLEEVDYLEAAPLYLGKNRSDRNAKRMSVLSEIDTALADYGKITFYRISHLLRKIRPVHRENEPCTKRRSFLSKRCRESA